MDKKGYQKRISVWWEALDTEVDNQRVNPSTFDQAPPKKSKSSAMLNPKHLHDINKKNPVNLEKCLIIKEALQKLYQFLSANHHNECTDKSCKYSSKAFKLKLSLERLRDDPVPQPPKKKKPPQRSLEEDKQTMSRMPPL